MDKKSAPKSYPKNKFDMLKEHIDSNIKEMFGYCVLTSKEQITKNLIGDGSLNAVAVAATTASNLQFKPYKCQGYTVANGEPSIILRIIRFDNTGHHNTSQHFNNEYFALIPTPRGQVIQISLTQNKFDKHFVELVNNVSVNETLRSMLPQNKSGSINEYYSNPKSPYVDIELIK